MPPATAASTSFRRHDLDWLRVIVFGLLIFYHVGMFYVTWGWHVKSDHASPALEPAMALLNPWRLALLFFISGVALRFAIDARGRVPMFRDRLWRLLPPLAFGMLVVVVPQAHLELLHKGEIEPGILAFYPRYLGIGDSDFSIITPTWNHLWYVAYALVYTLVVVVIAPALHRLQRTFGPGVAGLLVRRPLAILLLALPFVAYRLLLDPLFPTTHALVDDWATHAHFLTVLLFGWFAAGSEAFWSAVDRCLRPALALVVALGTAILVARLNWSAVRAADGGLEAIAVVRSLYAWCVIVTLLGLARRFLSWTSPTLAYLTEAVFPWYILHQTIIVMVGAWTIGRGLSFASEIALVTGATVLGCLAIHEFVIRRVGWLRPLFGLKRRRHRVVEAEVAFHRP